jgi:hypothetical protein
MTDRKNRIVEAGGAAAFLCAAALVALFGVVLTVGPVRALDAASCALYFAERQTLERMGVKANFEKGPKWALANLSASEIALIKRYIELDEALRFRCAPETVARAPVPDDAPRRLQRLPPLPQKRGLPVVAKPASAQAPPLPEAKLPARSASGG